MVGICFIKIRERDQSKMELIKTTDLYENQAFVIIEAQFATESAIVQEIAVGIKNEQGDITEIRTIARKPC